MSLPQYTLRRCPPDTSVQPVSTTDAVDEVKVAIDCSASEEGGQKQQACHLRGIAVRAAGAAGAAGAEGEVHAAAMATREPGDPRARGLVDDGLGWHDPAARRLRRLRGI